MSLVNALNDTISLIIIIVVFVTFTNKPNLSLIRAVYNYYNIVVPNKLLYVHQTRPTVITHACVITCLLTPFAATCLVLGPSTLETWTVRQTAHFRLNVNGPPFPLTVTMAMMSSWTAQIMVRCIDSLMSVMKLYFLHIQKVQFSYQRRHH